MPVVDGIGGQDIEGSGSVSSNISSFTVSVSVVISNKDAGGSNISGSLRLNNEDSKIAAVVIF